MEWYRVQVGPYQVPLHFVAQINFAETAPFDMEHQLPERGILYFFYDGEADARLEWLPAGNGMGWKVIFYDGDLTALSRREAPDDLEEYGDVSVYGAARLRFAAKTELPPLESDLFRYREFPEDREQYRRYLDWTVETDRGCYSQLLGHASTMFHGMERDCECLRQKLSCTLVGLEELAERGLDRDLSHWNLLLQVDSNRATDMIWSDMGWLCLWITREDLAARRFENCWLLRESG